MTHSHPLPFYYYSTSLSTVIHFIRNTCVYMKLLVLRDENTYEAGCLCFDGT